MPEGKAGDALTFKALQTYEDGDVVRWIGPEDADEPAPIVTLTEPRRASQAARRPRRDAAARQRVAGRRRPRRGRRPPRSGGDGLAIAALLVGGLGLAAGLAALVRLVGAPG